MRYQNESLERWEQRVERMNDKELLAEIRYHNHPTWHNGKVSLRDVAELTALEVVFQSHLTRHERAARRLPPAKEIKQEMGL